MARQVTRTRLIIGAVIIVVLADIGLGFYWNVEPDPLRRPKPDQSVGVATTTQLIDSIEALLHKHGGFLSNDVIPPGVLMDNMPNWEYGALIQLRDFTYMLRNQWSRPQAQSAGDPDLAKAFPKLNISRKSWMFPRAESSYGEAAEFLKHYRDRLAGKDGPAAEFLNRPNNLDLWLQVVSRRLGGLTQDLAQVGAASGSLGLFSAPNPLQPQQPGAAPFVSSVRQPDDFVLAADNMPGGEPAPGEGAAPQPDERAQGNSTGGPEPLEHSWLLADDYFYRARGAAWALLNLCRGIEVDFHDQLEQKQALDSFHFLEQTLEASQKTITTPVIMSGEYFSMVPNHPLTMAAFMASANATVINIRRLMIAD